MFAVGDTAADVRPKMLANKISSPARNTRAIWTALLPLMNPITLDTEYFGGTLNSMCA